MRLYADIYKNAGMSCTNDGASDYHDECQIIFDETLNTITKNPPSAPCVFVIVEGNIKGTLKAINFDQWLATQRSQNFQWSMFGGNFVYTSDSRFPSSQPIAIHDRYEG